jgi:hypothetical protein
VAGELNVCVTAGKKPTYPVITYPVIAEPLSLVGAVHDTVAWPAPAVAVTLVGFSGVPTMTDGVADDAPPEPTALVALTEHV